LPNYNFDVVHRPIEKTVHINALSRSVGAVNEFLVERKLEYLQLLDPEIKR